LLSYISGLYDTDGEGGLMAKEKVFIYGKAG
jgi:hypothetical protein